MISIGLALILIGFVLEFIVFLCLDVLGKTVLGIVWHLHVFGIVLV